MPPKKAETPLVVGEYDVELMTEKELKLYVEALKEEHKRMRKLRNLYHKDQNELLGILKTVQENTSNRRGIDLQNNWKIQQMVLELEQQSKYKDAANKIEEIETNRKNEINALNSFLNLKMAEIHNREQEDILMKTISDRDRQIQNMEYLHNLIPIQIKENDFVKRHGLSQSCESNIESFVKEYNKNFLKNLHEFSHTKIEMLLAVWGDIPQTENNPLADTVEKMNDYFKDIYLKNLKTVENLYSSLFSLKRELNALKLNLRDVTKENEKLHRIIAERKPSSPPSSSVAETLPSNTDKVIAFKELEYENYLLTAKLKMLNNEYEDLKSKFTSAVRKLYRKADFKSFLLEKKLLSTETTI